jgi:hypothetical protein
VVCEDGWLMEKDCCDEDWGCCGCDPAGICGGCMLSIQPSTGDWADGVAGGGERGLRILRDQEEVEAVKSTIH